MRSPKGGALHEKVCTPAMNVNRHPLAVDVADFQVCQFSASYSGGVERHQQGAMEGSTRGLDQSCDFFLAQDRRQVKCSLGIGSFGDAPGLLRQEAAEEFYSTHKTKASAKRLVFLFFPGQLPNQIHFRLTVRRSIRMQHFVEPHWWLAKNVRMLPRLPR
jgi:hypothetical protein